MAATTKKYIDPFAAFGNLTYKANIKALNGGEIEYRKLTSSEADYFQAQAMKSVVFGEHGEAEPKLDQASLENAANIKYEKLALVLVTPVKTVDELKGLSTDIINELVEVLLNEADAEVVDDEGN